MILDGSVWEEWAATAEYPVGFPTTPAPGGGTVTHHFWGGFVIVLILSFALLILKVQVVLDVAFSAVCDMAKAQLCFQSLQVGVSVFDVS